MDSQQRLISTEGLPFFTFAVPGMVERVDQTYRTETLQRTIV
jgi:hypothetical protein